MSGFPLPASAATLDIWVYLAASPLLWLTLTLAAFALAARIARASGGHPLVNPVLISAAILIALLMATGTPYASYFAGAQFVHFLLGPATVALAVPLHRNRARIRANLAPMLLALAAGSLTAILVATASARLLGAPREVWVSLAPKSVTAPIAMALAERFGGLPTLAAALVITTGVLGAMIVTPLMNALRIKDFAARGFAAGLAAHGIGAARAFQVDAVAGAFAGVAIGLNGALTALILPVLMPLLDALLR